MTNSERIYTAWKRSELRRSVPEYLELLTTLCGEKLSSEQAAMCEELFLLDLVTRIPATDGSGDIRYLCEAKKGKQNEAALLYWVMFLENKVAELENKVMEMALVEIRAKALEERMRGKLVRYAEAV